MRNGNGRLLNSSGWLWNGDCHRGGSRWSDGFYQLLGGRWLHDAASGVALWRWLLLTRRLLATKDILPRRFPTGHLLRRLEFGCLLIGRRWPALGRRPLPKVAWWSAVCFCHLKAEADDTISAASQVTGRFVPPVEATISRRACFPVSWLIHFRHTLCTLHFQTVCFCCVSRSAGFRLTASFLGPPSIGPRRGLVYATRTCSIHELKELALVRP